MFQPKTKSLVCCSFWGTARLYFWSDTRKPVLFLWNKNKWQKIVLPNSLKCKRIFAMFCFNRFSVSFSFVFLTLEDRQRKKNNFTTKKNFFLLTIVSVLEVRERTSDSRRRIMDLVFFEVSIRNNCPSALINKTYRKTLIFSLMTLRSQTKGSTRKVV